MVLRYDDNSTNNTDNRFGHAVLRSAGVPLPGSDSSPSVAYWQSSWFMRNIWYRHFGVMSSAGRVMRAALCSLYLPELHRCALIMRFLHGDWCITRSDTTAAAIQLCFFKPTECYWREIWYTSRQLKLKAKAVSLHDMKALGGEEYCSYSFSTSALDWGEWSASRPGRALVPGKGHPVHIVQEAGWALKPVWTQKLQEKSFAPAGDRTSIARSSSPYPDTHYHLMALQPKSGPGLPFLGVLNNKLFTGLDC
jgi:hypothetical protein